MKHMNEKWIVFLSVLFLMTWMGCHRAHVNVRDDFEGTALSKIWSTDRMELHSFKIQSKIVHSGKNAAMITLRTGDVVEAATDKDKATERDELLESWQLYSTEGVNYEYQFSMFLPDSFPILPVRLVIAQWKQFGFFSEYSPVLALRYQSGRLFITLQTDTIRHTLWELNEEVRNRWLDFTFQIKFSRQVDGKVKAFLNGIQIVNYKGITSYSWTLWHLPIKNRYYFKMGLYRDRISEPMSIYIDEYEKKEILE